MINPIMAKGGLVLKLNYDCFRDVMLALEEHLTMDEWISYEKFSSFKQTERYTESEIVYALIKLKEAGFIDSDNNWHDNAPHPIVSDITYEGHGFINNVRDSGVWSQAKKKAGEVVSGISIALLGELAGHYIKQKLGLS